MQNRYRRRRKRMRTGTLLLVLLFSAVFLVSCVAGTGTLWVQGFFGSDLHAFMNEATVCELETDDAKVASLVEVIDVLPAGSASLQTFDGTSEMLKYYRDAILNDLLRDNYALYTGNSHSLSAAGEPYPYTVLTTLIPAKDMENAVSRYFGGSGVRHCSSTVYTYLDRSGAYTTVMQPWQSRVEIEVTRAEECASGYRLYVTLTDATGSSASYCAIFQKRADGSAYLRALQEA